MRSFELNLSKNRIIIVLNIIVLFSCCDYLLPLSICHNIFIPICLLTCERLACWSSCFHHSMEADKVQLLLLYLNFPQLIHLLRWQRLRLLLLPTFDLHQKSLPHLKALMNQLQLTTTTRCLKPWHTRPQYLMRTERATMSPRVLVEPLHRGRD